MRIQKAKRKCIAGIKRKRRRLSKVAKQTKAYEYAHPDIASPSNGSHSFDMLSNDVTPTNASLLNDLSKKCKRVAQVNSDHETNEPSLKKFPVLKPKSHYVPVNVVKDEWSTLPDRVQDQVNALFKSAEHLAIAKFNDERRNEVQVALSPIIKGLGKRLPRMPFPPGISEAHFDLESMTRDNRALEMQLTPALHTLAVLKSEVAKERHSLRKDEIQNDGLRQNAQTEDRLRQQHATKLHKSLRPRNEEDLNTASDSIGLVVSLDKKQTLINPKTRDAKLQSVVTQIQKHMESIEHNLSNVQGIDTKLLEINGVIGELLHR